jgi:hypothetical protein
MFPQFQVYSSSHNCKPTHVTSISGSVAIWISTGLPINSNSAASQEIPLIYRTRRFISEFTSAILGHSNSVHASPSNFLKTNFNIIFSFTPRSPKCTPSLGSPHQNPVCTALLPCVLTSRPSQSFWFWSSVHLVRNTGHKAPRYEVFSTPLLLWPLQFTTRVHRQFRLRQNATDTASFRK